MLLDEVLILELLKLKIVNLILQGIRIIAKKMLFLQAKYEANVHSESSNSINLTNISSRIKKILLFNKEIINKRMNECKKCEFLTNYTNQCTKCSCFMNVKVRIATASCPIGKWGREDGNTSTF